MSTLEHDAIPLHSMAASRNDRSSISRFSTVGGDTDTSRGTITELSETLELSGDGGSADDPYLTTHDGYVDGGYGWVVTAGAFTLLFLQLGILYAWGVFQAELANQSLGNSVVLSTIGGVSGFCTALGCLPGSLVVSRFGPRITAMASVLIAAGSLLVSSFLTRSVVGLVLVHGIVFGSACALGFITAYTIPSQYFLKRRGLSTGMASCGAGIGGAAMALIAQRTISEWGLPWTFRFLSCITLVLGVPAALVLKPGYIALRPTTTSLGTEKGMFKSSRYIRLLVACFVASYPFFIPPYVSINLRSWDTFAEAQYIPQYAQSVGLSASQGALYSALFNITSGIGRIAFGFLADAFLGNLNSWTLALITIALSSLLIWPNATDQGLIIVFVVICGLGSGGFFSLQSSIVGQIIGSHRVRIGVGWLEVAMSFGNLAGPISAGALLDAFGGPGQGAGPYKPAIYLVGATTAASAITVASIRYSTSRTIWGKV